MRAVKSLKAGGDTTPGLDLDQEIAPLLAEEKPSQCLSPAGFFELLRRWPARASSSVYLYRTWPRIDRRRVGIEHKYIDIFPLDEDPLTEAKITKLHGDGKYMLKHSDANRGRGRTEVSYCKLSISGSGIDPVISDLNELVPDARENKDFIQMMKAQGKYGATGKEPGNQMADSTLATLATELVRRSNGAAPDPVEQLQRLQQIQGTPLENAVKIVQLLKPQQQDNGLRDLMPLLVELIKRPAAPAPADGLEKSFELLERADKLFGRRHGESSGFPWQAVLAGIPAALSGFQNLAALYLASKTGAPLTLPPNEPQPQETSMEIKRYQEIAKSAITAFRRNIGGAEWVNSLHVVDPEAVGVLVSLNPDLVMSTVADKLPADVNPELFRAWVKTVFTAFEEEGEEAA